MSNLYAVLLLVSILSLVVGIIKPSIFSRLKINSRKKVFLVFGSLIILLFVLFGVTSSEVQNTVGSKKPETAQKSKSVQTPTPLPKVGERVEDKKIVFTVLNTEKRNAIGAYFTQTAQGTFLILNLKIENIDTKTRSVSFYGFKLKDSQNRTYSISVYGQTALSVEQRKADLTLQVQPSLFVKNNIVFDIPKDARGLILTVQGGTLSSGKEISLGI